MADVLAAGLLTRALVTAPSIKERLTKEEVLEIIPVKAQALCIFTQAAGRVRNRSKAIERHVTPGPFSKLASIRRIPGFPAAPRQCRVRPKEVCFVERSEELQWGRSVARSAEMRA